MTAEGEEGGRARRETERRVTSATSLLLPTPGDAPPPVGFRERARALAYQWRGSLLRSSRGARGSTTAHHGPVATKEAPSW